MNSFRIFHSIRWKMRMNKKFKKMDERPRKLSDLEDYENEFNAILFERFSRDFERHAFPAVPRPTAEEIEAYKKQREERASENSRFYSNLDFEKLEIKNKIPIEVEIWVDKVYNMYLGDLFPMFGQAHRCFAARKRLYKYRGFTWYNFAELHPGVMVD